MTRATLNQHFTALLARIEAALADHIGALEAEVARREALDHEGKRALDKHNQQLAAENAALREANATLRAQIKRAEEQEPVGYEYRFLDTHPHTVTSGQWSEWARVEPRNPHTETFKDRAAEIQAYIDAGFSYQLRGLYAYPIPSAPVPEGWKLVPMEPTPEMVELGCDCRISPNGTTAGGVIATWNAMLAAAPSPTEKKES